MKSLCLYIVSVCALVAGESVPATLSGRVFDPSGAVAPGALLRLTNRDGGAVTAVIADGGGRYVARDLPPGNYTIAVESPGFAPYLRQDVRIQGGETARMDVVLSVSTVTEQLTVTAKAPAGEGEFETRPQNSREILEIREVRESAAKDVGEALAGLEGLWKIRKGGIANDVVLRGFQQGNINVLIDGARVLGACPNHMDPSAFHVDFAEIESVQVTKGPFDMRNQGSLGGTVNVVTRKPEDGFQLTPNVAGGSYGYFNPSLQGSYAVGRAYLLGGYSYRRSDIYRDGSGRRVTDYANYTASGRDNRAFDINTGWMKFSVAPSRNQNIEVAYTRQAGGLTLYPYLLMDAIYDNADRASASWGLQSSGMVRRVSAQGYFTRVKHWMTDELRSSSVGAARSYGMATFAGTKTLGGRLEAELPDTFVGVETYSRNWNAVNTLRLAGNYVDQPSLPDVRILAGGVYAQHHRYFGKLRVTAGARLDVAGSEARSRDLNTNLFWAYQDTSAKSATDLNPSASLWVTYALPKGLELFGGAGSTVRLPDPEERYFALRRMGSDWVGNPDLVPTRNNEADAGIHLRTGRFSLRPTLFYSRLDNFIALYSQTIQHPAMGIMNTAARSYGNVDARIYGGELSYSVAFSHAVLFSGGTSYTRGTQYAKPGAGIQGGSIAEMPPLKSRASVRYGNRLFFGEVDGLAVARQDKVDVSLREAPTAGYALLGFKVGVHHKRLRLSAGVDNLLNRFYYDHLSFQRDPFRSGTRIPDPGRTFFVNLSVIIE